jgi:Flp pilus assembly pilin Flp
LPHLAKLLTTGGKMKKPSKFKQNNKGQALTEYLILTALIAISSIAIVQVLSSNIRRKMATVSESIRGSKVEYKGIQASDKHYKVYDLGDFNKNMIDTNE